MLDFVLGLLPGGGLLSAVFNLAGGWDSVIGLACPPLAAASFFFRKWKWLLLGLAVAAAVIAVVIRFAALSVEIAHLERDLAEEKRVSQRHADNFADCQAANDSHVALLDRIERRASEDMAAVTSTFERKLELERRLTRARKEIRDGEKTCVGSAGPYRAALDSLRRDRAGAAAEGRDENSGGEGRAAGSPVDLQRRTSHAPRLVRRRGQRGLVLRRNRGGRGLPQGAGRLAAALLATLIGLTLPAAADPPAGADSALGPWFRSLKIPGSETSCCDLSDCRTVAYRVVVERDENDFVIAGHIEVLITPESFPVEAPLWERVPPERVLTRHDNPTGKAVACWTPWQKIICFVRPIET